MFGALAYGGDPGARSLRKAIAMGAEGKSGERRRPGRPAKAAAERRDAVIGVRVNAGERALLADRAAAAGWDVGTYLREAGLRRRIVGAVPAVNVEAWRALARTTSNLNQLTAHLNAGHRPDPTGTRRLGETLTALAEAVRVLRLALLGVTPEAVEEAG